MVVPQTYVVALLMTIVTMLCWGSWANVVKLTKNWRFELLYFDYAFGVLLGAVIAASGAYHHTLAGGDRLLVEGYYPAAVPMQVGEVSEMRALWRFSARYLHFLSDSRSEPVDTSGLRLGNAAGDLVPWSKRPEAGAIWVRASRTPGGQTILHLIDLRTQRDDLWDTPKLPPARSPRLRFSWDALGSPVAASPWADDGDATTLSGGATGEWVLPEFRRWLMVVGS